jgi:lipoprotein-anchoring transpeptidase ErfK/SrfK
MSTPPMRNGAALAGLFLLSLDAIGQDVAPPAEPAPTQATQEPSEIPPPAEPTSAVQPEPTPTPTPTATPEPSPSISAEQAAEQTRMATANALFTAVFHNDTTKVRELLAAGADPNATMPVPVDPAVVELFRPTVLNYFLSGERGLTPLMVAATLGHMGMAEMLLQAGANPEARTKRHGTNALWLAGYKGHTDVTKLLLDVQPGSEPDRMRIEVDLDAQTAQLFIDNTPEEAVPISSGRKGYPTPKGEFVVTNKHRHWRSTIYGSSMPYYLRLSCRAFGLHAGQLPGYPASHGCIRLNKKDAQSFFERVPVGTVVVIK